MLPKILLSVVSTLLFLGMLEGGSRLVRHFEGPQSPMQGGYIENVGQHDYWLFWKLKPGYRDKSGRIAINSTGQRGPELAPKEDGDLRILSLGESTTFAARIPYEASYSHVLQDELQGVLPEARVRVINAGVPGYSLFQGVKFLHHEALALEPDVVLLYFGYNDFLPVSYLVGRVGDGESAPRRDDEQVYLDRLRPSSRLAEALSQSSNFYRGLTSLMARLAPDHAGEVKRDRSHVRVPEAPRRRSIEDAIAFCREKGIRLVILVPWYAGFKEHVPLLREFADRKDVLLVDLPKHLPRGTPDLFFDPVHPNARGHAMIANAIAKQLAPGLRP